MSDQTSKLTTSDAELIDRARSGDSLAFGDVWRRHYRSAARVARQFRSPIDADELVSEAYGRIYRRVLAGGGPSGAFRPYLYMTIRNLARIFEAASRGLDVDVNDDFEDDRTLDDPAAWVLDRTLTARAFRSLPERSQTVLWYTEVEGMDPHEVAPLMGLTANGVAALSYRAREALRMAWLQANVSDAEASGDCQWAMSCFGEHARDGLSSRDSERLTAHLAGCIRCAIVSEEAEEVGSHLAMVMLPLLLGGVAGSSLLAAMGHDSTAYAASLSIPDAPLALPATAANGGLAGPIAGGLSMGAATGAGTLVGAFAVIAVMIGGIALGVAPTLSAEADSGRAPLQQSVSDDDSAVGADTGTYQQTTALHAADVSVHLTGTGTPGASVTAWAAGNTFAKVLVDASGCYVIDIAALPGGISSLDLVQSVDRNYLRAMVLANNPLAEVLGLLDGLSDALVQPLGLSSVGGTVDIHLVG